ncbi:MAG: FG-GAP repeat domain-containing protein, partial [Limisphaerales bacterium]
GNIIRYNISHNDGRKNGYPGMFVYGPVSNADIYNNTVIIQQTNGSPPALIVQNGARNIRFRNNIFYSAGGARLVHILPGNHGLVFQNNCYYAADGSFSIVQDGSNYRTLSAWQDGTGQETYNGQKVGFEVDPRFISIGEPRLLNDANALGTLTGYRLDRSSPLLSKGLDLTSLFGLNPGNRDFFTTTPATRRFNLGAHTFGGGAGSASLYFQNEDGRLALWRMDDVNLLEADFLRKGTRVNSGTWRAFSTADINRDGAPDVIFQNVNGTMAAWLMQESTFLRATALRSGSSPGVGWRAVAVADVNNDGEPDVLFQNPSGQVLAWLMNGTEFVSETLLFGGQAAGPGWKVVGVGDLNHDGSNDVLFQHGDGRLAVWMLNNTEFEIKALRTAAPPSVWRIVAIEDLDQDGNLDIIWRHASGQLAVWKMSQTDFVGSSLIRNGHPVASHWRVIGAR